MHSREKTSSSNESRAVANAVKKSNHSREASLTNPGISWNGNSNAKESSINTGHLNPQSQKKIHPFQLPTHKKQTNIAFSQPLQMQVPSPNDTAQFSWKKTLGLAGLGVGAVAAGLLTGGLAFGALATGAAIGGGLGLLAGEVADQNAPANGPVMAHNNAPVHVPAPVAVPTLSAARNGGMDQEGQCGSFQRTKDWQVANPVQGVIIQHVTRAFNVFDVNTNAALAGGALNAYVTSPSSSVDATVTDYWELWTVDAAGNISDGGDDTFGLCAIIPGRKIRNTTRGTYIITGTANFYPTNAAPAAFGFARNAVGTAGGLFSKFGPPVNLPAQAGPTINHQVTVQWDSSHDGRVYTGPFGDQYSVVNEVGPA